MYITFKKNTNRFLNGGYSHLKKFHIRENPDIYALNLGLKGVKAGVG